MKTGYVSTANTDGTYTVQKVSGNAYYVDNSGKPVYGDLEKLLADSATNGRAIKLLDDVVTYGTDFLYLRANKTIDLNGKTLVLPGKLFGFGKIIDSTDGAGLLKIGDMDGSQLPSDNGYLPVKDTEAGGYRLYKYMFELFVSKKTGLSYNKVDDNRVMFVLKLKFTNPDAWNKLATDDDSVQLSFVAEWNTNKAIFDFRADTLNKAKKDVNDEGYVNFMMTVNGFSTLGDAKFSMTPQLKCALFTQTIDSIIYSSAIGG